MRPWRIWWRSGRVRCGRRSQHCVSASTRWRNPLGQVGARRTSAIQYPCRMASLPAGQQSLRHRTGFPRQISVDPNLREEVLPLKSPRIRNLSGRLRW